jgi:predicted DCC family thiol-disulfide oxidoreductase YuxK
MDSLQNKKIVFFDAKCILCNRSVQFILNADKSESIHVAALQSELGKQIMKNHDLQADQFNTILYWDSHKLYKKSSASLKIARDMKTWLSFTHIFILLPKVIRDGIYNWISRNRFRWFGRTDSCLISHPRFLNGDL